jgi:gamma-glutamyl hercynylcysteine S-oxide hydrolase
MCRHLAYLGDQTTLRSLLMDPPYSLQAQAWAPRRQRHGVINADGFGVGWYADGDPVPARYRRAKPIWSDPTFADLARVTRSRAVLAAVRDATEDTEAGETAAAPYAADRWLFSHNGALSGWPETGAALAADLPAGDVLALEARCDSAVIWAVVLRRLRAGSGLAGALEETIRELTARHLGGRFNFLLTDGETIAATAAGDTLCYRASPAGVVVASEPGDDEPGWVDVPDQSLVQASVGSVTVRPICADVLTSGDGSAAGGGSRPDAPGMAVAHAVVAAAAWAAAGTGAAAAAGPNGRTPGQ